eukprot:9475747-Pyramimonas_sp.AAC.1
MRRERATGFYVSFPRSLKWRAAHGNLRTRIIYDSSMLIPPCQSGPRILPHECTSCVLAFVRATSTGFAATDVREVGAVDT